MRNLLVTSSLLDSVQWLKTCPPNWKEQAHIDLISTLERRPWDPNVWCKRGIEFENMLDCYCGENELLLSMKRRIENGLSQQKKSKKIDINGNEIVIYGRSDYLFPKKIIDVKTTYKTKSKTKPQYYKERNQHKVYSYLWDINSFEYLIAHLGEDKDNLIPFQVSSININVEFDEDDMIKTVSEFIKDLQSIDLYDLYVNVYNGER